jgi:hypothetical protein
MVRPDDPHSDGLDRDEVKPEASITVIDYDEFMEAQRDPRVIARLRAARREGERVEREGRKRW